jgi:hypothetical protein
MYHHGNNGVSGSGESSGVGIQRQTIKSALLFLLLLFFLPSITPPEALCDAFSGNGQLFMVEDLAGKGTGSLKELPVELYQRIPPYYLISAPEAYKNSIEKKGFSFVKTIEHVEAGKSLFVLSVPEFKPLGKLPSAGKILFRGDNWVLVKGSEDLVSLFGGEGFMITAVLLRPLPLETRAGHRSFYPGSVSLSPEARQKAAASDTTILQYLQRLENFQTRHSYTDSVIAAAEWIYNEFVAMGFTDVEYDSLFVSGRWQRNIVATKTGSVNPDQVIVIGGHYDSVVYGDTCDTMEWAPGVDDDGSGTALTMDLARILVNEDVKVTLKFVPFAAEEQGLHGSGHYAEEAFNSGMDIILMVNMDMVGNVSDAQHDVNIYTDNQSMSYAELMRQVAEDSTYLLPRISMSGSGSDHYYFQQYGFNHVYAAEGDFSPNWHRCSDIIENVDIPYMVQVEKMILPTILLVANAPSTPTNLVASDYGDGTRFQLEWDQSPDSDLWGYHIYTGTAEGEYDDIDTSFVNSFLLENLTQGDSVYVAVSTLDDLGYESILSDPLGILPMVRPRPPEGFDATSSSSQVEIVWNENSELDLAGYIVYRKDRGEPDYSPLDTLSAGETTLVDSDLQSGHYYLYQVTAYDTSGTEGDPSAVARGRLATHDGGILVIDATRDGTGGPFAPTDEAVDLFYEGLMSDFNLMAQWDYADSIALTRRPVDADMGLYSTVVLHRDDRSGEALAPDTTHLMKYLDNGGNLLCGGWLLLSVLQDTEVDFQPGSFFYDYLKVPSFVTSLAGDRDFIGAASASGDYSDLAIDEDKVLTGALFSLDIFDSSPVEGQEIYTYVSSDSASSDYHGMGMGLEYIGGDFGVVVVNFPIFYMDSSDAADMMDAVLTAFGEGPSDMEGDGTGGKSGLPRVYSLGQNYPNPFNPSTTITFSIPAGSGKVHTRVTIYDIRGRLVNRIVDEEKEPGLYQVHWDGRDERGSMISSGVYLYTITAGDYSSTRKMVVVR